MQSKAKTVEAYLAELPEDRRAAIEAVRAVIRKNLDPEYEEGMQYGMIGYYVPHRVYPQGYHCDPKQPLPFGGLASQKNHMSLYLMCLYGASDAFDWFRKAWEATGKKLDMGKACIRFKKLDDLPLELIGEVVRRTPVKVYVSRMEAALRSGSGRTSGAAKETQKKTSAKPSKRPSGKSKRP
ncbi:MAG: DUF1801 domain-containing protein [Phycisphaerae bacterium]|nr:DUF1801 domain-containing protein [Phycisphaerae bacterium]